MALTIRRPAVVPSPGDPRRCALIPGAGTAEHDRLAALRTGLPWRAWGPYVAERAWGTVREDYSATATRGTTFPHDHARSRAYRWSEDGLAGVCDEHQNWCLGLALWNGADPILKERIFGLSGPEGNHGEDVKEYWWYVDSTPTHSWMRWRYHYPQREFPYDDLRGRATRGAAATSRSTSSSTPASSTTTGTGSVTVDYAKADPHDLLHARSPWPTTARTRRTLARAADAVVPQHLGVGVAEPAPTTGRGRRRSARRGRPAARPSTASAGALDAGRRRRARAAVLRQRDQRRSGSRRCRAARRTRRTASTTTSSHGAPTVNPAHESAPRRRLHYALDRAGRRVSREIRLRLARRPAAEPARPRRRLRRR